MAKASDALKVLRQFADETGPRTGFFSTAEEAISRAPFSEGTPKQWREYLKPGRTVRREGAPFSLRGEEVEWAVEPALRGIPEDRRVGIEDLRNMVREDRPVLRSRVGTNDPGAAERIRPYRGDVDLDTAQFPPTDGGMDVGGGSLTHRSSGMRPEDYEEDVTRMSGLESAGAHFSPDALSWSRASRHQIPGSADTGTPGSRVRLVEEIQSDVHGNAAKRQILSTDTDFKKHLSQEEYGRFRELRKSEARDDLTSEELKSLRELRQTARRRAPRRGYRTPSEEDEFSRLSAKRRGSSFFSMEERNRLEDLSRKAPDAPFKDFKGVGRLELRKQLLNAIDEGDEYLAITRGADQVARSGEGKKKSMEHAYDKLLRGELRKLSDQYGGEFTEVDVPVRSQDSPILESVREHDADTISEMVDNLEGIIDNSLKRMKRRGSGSATVDVSRKNAMSDFGPIEESMDWLEENADLRGDELDAIDALRSSIVQNIRSGNQGRTRESIQGFSNLVRRLENRGAFSLEGEEIRKTFPAVRITDEMRENVKRRGVPVFQRGGAVRANARRGRRRDRDESDSEGLARLREILDSLPVFPGTDEESVQEDRARVAQGLASQLMSTDPETGEPAMLMPWDEGFRPGVADEFAALPSILDLFGEGTAPEWSREAAERFDQRRRGIREEMELENPEGFGDHAMESLGIMLGQAPVPGSVFKRGASHLKKIPGWAGTATRGVTAPFRAGVEWFSPIVEPKPSAYGLGTAFGATMGMGADAAEEGERERSRERVLDPERRSMTDEEIQEFLSQDFAKGGAVRTLDGLKSRLKEEGL